MTAAFAVAVLLFSLPCRVQAVLWVVTDEAVASDEFAAAAESQWATTVGFPLKLEGIVLSGGLRSVTTAEDRHEPFVVRIVESWPHGTATRYDLEVYALEPGQYDVAQYLSLSVGEDLQSGSADSESIMVTVESTLPEGQILPAAVETAPLPAPGGYGMLLVLGGFVWTVGLAMLLFFGRRHAVNAEIVAEKPIALADSLRPLVAAARRGELDSAGQAELERMLTGYWTRRLKLTGQSPAEVLIQLRTHEVAGQLLQTLEDWLHRPDVPEPADLDVLLAPYEDVSEPDLGEDDPIAGGGR